MIKSRKDFIGVTCKKMFHTGVGSVLRVDLERCHIDMQKHLCDNTTSVTQWNALE